MRCPACGYPSSSVKDSRCWDGKTVDRRRACEDCGARWTTRETPLRGTLIGPPEEPTRNDTIRSQPVEQISPQIEQPLIGSPCIPSGSDSGSGSSQTLSSDPDQTRVERRATPRRRKTDESPAFIAWYSAYPRKIARGEAWKAWQQMAEVLVPLDAMLATLAWQIPEWSAKTKAWGYEPPHPASYLRAKRWLDEKAVNTNAASAKPAGPTFCDWHSSYVNNGKPSKYPKDWCSECKHAAAKSRQRVEGEPTSIADLVGNVAP